MGNASGKAGQRPSLVSESAELRNRLTEFRQMGHRIGLVPTMGALHAGHLSLVQASRRECGVTVVTIFVNPSQFGPQEDFGRYPRTLDADLELLSREQVDVVFVPSVELMYPEGFSTWVDPPGVATLWEGVCRPGHFRGVATVVLKLFHLIPADIAFFGQKDFQQCRVIEQMVADLAVPIELRRCPIVRERDGLALSSRNRYLTADERHQATALSRGLQVGQQRIREGERRAKAVEQAIRQELLDAGITRIDYVAVADPETLEELTDVSQGAVLLIAAHVGTTRLIDNCVVEGAGTN